MESLNELLEIESLTNLYLKDNKLDYYPDTDLAQFLSPL